MGGLTYLQAIAIGLMQGVTELFPVSSLGHSVVVPALIGGSWERLVTQTHTASGAPSPYLSFIVALHVATAIALLLFFWRDWLRVIGGFVSSIKRRRIKTPAERLAWLIIIATIPAGLAGLLLDHELKRLFSNPLAASVFLIINGIILITGERLRRRSAVSAPVRESQLVGAGAPGLPGTPRASGSAPASLPTGTAGSAGLRSGQTASWAADNNLTVRISPRTALVVGCFQVLALLAGISRSGVTMVGGLLRGLDHETAARFTFLLATPIILAAGLLKLPELVGASGAGIRGQVLIGSLVAGVAAYLSVRFLTRYFRGGNLLPFAVYSLLLGAVGVWWFG